MLMNSLLSPYLSFTLLSGFPLCVGSTILRLNQVQSDTSVYRRKPDNKILHACTISHDVLRQCCAQCLFFTTTMVMCG